MKVQAPEAARLECLKTIAARAAARHTRLFEVPAVLFCSPAEGSIVFERLAWAEPLCGVLDAAPRTALHAIAAQLGRAIAAVHAIPPLQGEESLAYIGNLALDARHVAFAHGDLCVANILVERGSSRLGIVDWSSAPWLPAFANAHPIVDLANFGLSLFVDYRLNEAAIERRLSTWTAFWSGYRETARDIVGIEHLSEVARALWGRLLVARKTARAHLRMLMCSPVVHRALRRIGQTGPC